MLIQKKIFYKKDCKKILSLINVNNLGHSYLNLSTENTNKKGKMSFEQYKINSDVDTDWFIKIIKNFIYENTKIFVNEIKLDVQILKYTINSQFPKHRDSDNTIPTNPNQQRLFTIGILLNEDFEGGDLIVYDNKKNYLKKTTGNSYIFESSLEHEVTKITSGIRYVLVAHLRSKEVQKKLI